MTKEQANEKGYKWFDNQLFIFFFRILLIENAILLVSQADASETIGTRVAFNAIFKILTAGKTAKTELQLIGPRPSRR